MKGVQFRACICFLGTEDHCSRPSACRSTVCGVAANPVCSFFFCAGGCLLTARTRLKAPREHSRPQPVCHCMSLLSLLQAARLQINTMLLPKLTQAAPLHAMLYAMLYA